MSDVNWSDLRADYENGSSLRQLAAKYGVSKSTIGERKFKEQWDKPKGRTTADIGRRTADTQQAHIDTDLTPEKDTSTKDKQRLFLEAFAEHANVLVSARAAGISRQIVYTWLEHDEDFSFAYNQAKEDAKDVLREEIYRRGKEGWEEDVYSFGKFQGTVRKYDTTLLIFHAKMLMPEYREKGVTINNVLPKEYHFDPSQDGVEDRS